MVPQYWLEKLNRIFKQNEKKDDLIKALISGAIWATETEIKLTYIITWINNNLESLRKKGATEVNVIQGDAFVEYLKTLEPTSHYSYDPEKLSHSVILVAMDLGGNIINDQMICSHTGLSAQDKEQFKGQPILKINIS